MAALAQAFPDSHLHATDLPYRLSSWAMDDPENNRVLQCTGRLSQDQLTAPCWLSQGSVLRTLIHILDVQWYWRLGCQEGELLMRRLSEEGYTDVPALQVYWREEDERLETYVKSLSKEQAAGEVIYR